MHTYGSLQWIEKEREREREREGGGVVGCTCVKRAWYLSSSSALYAEISLSASSRACFSLVLFSARENASPSATCLKWHHPFPQSA
jgi:hypothetical protein